MVTFFKNCCIFQDLTSGRKIGSAEMRWGLYQTSRADYSSVFRSFISSSLSMVSNSDLLLWHQHLGHPSLDYLRCLYPSFSSNKIQDFICEHCILAKQTKTSHPNHAYNPSKPFHFVHSDIWGPSRTSNLTNTRWFITFIDDHTRICWVFLMKDKS